jgi:hypothetical protein
MVVIKITPSVDGFYGWVIGTWLSTVHPKRAATAAHQWMVFILMGDEKYIAALLSVAHNDDYVKTGRLHGRWMV